MNGTLGVVLIIAGGLLILAVSFVLRTRLPGPVVFALAAGASVAVGTGALLVQSHVSAAEWGLTLVALALLGPAHVRIVFGPLGRRSTQPA